MPPALTDELFFQADRQLSASVVDGRAVHLHLLPDRSGRFRKNHPGPAHQLLVRLRIHRVLNPRGCRRRHQPTQRSAQHPLSKGRKFTVNAAQTTMMMSHKLACLLKEENVLRIRKVLA